MSSILESPPSRITVAAASALGLAADILSQSTKRSLLPDLYQEHAGNFGIPWCLAFIFNFIGQIVEGQGHSCHDLQLIHLGQNIRLVGISFIIGVVIGVESQFINNPTLLRENLGDALVSLGAIILGSLAASTSQKHLASRQN